MKTELPGKASDIPDLPFRDETQEVSPEPENGGAAIPGEAAKPWGMRNPGGVHCRAAPAGHLEGSASLLLQWSGSP